MNKTQKPAPNMTISIIDNPSTYHLDLSFQIKNDYKKKTKYDCIHDYASRIMIPCPEMVEAWILDVCRTNLFILHCCKKY